MGTDSGNDAPDAVQSSSVQIAALMNEIAFAEALLELARIAHDPASAHQYIENAKRSCEVALSVLMAVNLTRQQAHEIRNQLNRVRLWLASTTLSSPKSRAS
jgi:hypothetical protein